MKSKGIHGLSKILIEKYKGEVPGSFEALEELPGAHDFGGRLDVPAAELEAEEIADLRRRESRQEGLESAVVVRCEFVEGHAPMK